MREAPQHTVAVADKVDAELISDIRIDTAEFLKHLAELRAIAEEVNHSSLRDTIDALAAAAR